MAVRQYEISKLSLQNGKTTRTTILMAEHHVAPAGSTQKITINRIITHAKHTTDASGYKASAECAAINFLEPIKIFL